MPSPIENAEKRGLDDSADRAVARQDKTRRFVLNYYLRDRPCRFAALCANRSPRLARSVVSRVYDEADAILRRLAGSA